MWSLSCASEARMRGRVIADCDQRGRRRAAGRIGNCSLCAPDGCTIGVAFHRSRASAIAVPICVPVVVPNVQLTPSRTEPQTSKPAGCR